MARWENNFPKPGKVMEDCMNSLVEEIQQAVAWSRPSILVAVHKSKNDQAHTRMAMEHRLRKQSMQVISIVPESDSQNILNNMFHESNSQGSIFFVYGLGDRAQVYAGLNMYRESIVENKVKVIFWLTVEEIVLLSRLAPDFWAFRHRVIEFPTGRSTRRSNLPVGVLLWHYENSMLNLDTVRERIVFQEKLLPSISLHDETIVNHVQAVGELAYYLWFVGENQKVTELLHQEIERIKSIGLTDLHSMLLNSLAINSFDQDDPRDALQWIEQALELTPKRSLLWSNHGIICRSAGQGKKSLSSLKRAVRLNPSSHKSWGVLGYMYMSLGKYSTALLNFEKAFSLQEKTVYLYPALATCQMRIGNDDEFTKVMGRLSDLAKGSEYLSICHAGLSGNIADALSKLNGLIQREKVPRIFVRRDPNLHFIFEASALREFL